MSDKTYAQLNSITITDRVSHDEIAPRRRHEKPLDTIQLLIDDAVRIQLHA